MSSALVSLHCYLNTRGGEVRDLKLDIDGRLDKINIRGTKLSGGSIFNMLIEQNSQSWNLALVELSHN